MKNKFKINLHAHTRYSDGGCTIEEHAKAAKELGFCCCCITDHVYSKASYYSLEKDTFEKAVREARRVSKKKRGLWSAELHQVSKQDNLS